MIHVTNTAPKHLKIKGHLEKGYTVQKSQIIPWDYKGDTNRKPQHHPTSSTPPPTPPSPKSTNQKKPKGNRNHHNFGSQHEPQKVSALQSAGLSVLFRFWARVSLAVPPGFSD